MTSAIEDIFVPPETRARRRRRIRTWIVLGTAGIVFSGSILGIGKLIYDTCGSIDSGVYRIEGECVGVTDGSYLFDPEFEEVQQKIEEENARVRTEAQSYVTVALLELLTPTATSATSAEEVRGELEGAYTAQRSINKLVLPTSSSPQIQLVLANQGNTDGQWQHVADQLVEMKAGDHPLVAVIGLGISTAQTRQRARDLSSHDIAMVASLLTADELDHNRIQGLIRVAPTDRDYAMALRRYVDTRQDLRSAVVVYDMNSDTGADLFTKSLKENFEQQMGHLINGRPLLPFFGAAIPSEAGPGRFDLVTPNICTEPPINLVIYAGRQVDLSGFLQSLGSRQCRSTPLTVITAGDMGVLLNEQEQALTAAKLTVVYAGTSDAEGWKRGLAEPPQNYDSFLTAFKEEHGFDENYLNDSQAIMMHDALRTAAIAVSLAAPGNSVPTGAKVRSVLLNLNGAFKVLGAGGTLSFVSRETGAGNPVGKPVPVLKFPSPPGDPFGEQVVLPPYKTQ